MQNDGVGCERDGDLRVYYAVGGGVRCSTDGDMVLFCKQFTQEFFQALVQY